MVDRDWQRERRGAMSAFEDTRAQLPSPFAGLLDPERGADQHPNPHDRKHGARPTHVAATGFNLT